MSVGRHDGSGDGAERWWLSASDESEESLGAGVRPSDNEYEAAVFRSKPRRPNLLRKGRSRSVEAPGSVAEGATGQLDGGPSAEDDRLSPNPLLPSQEDGWADERARMQAHIDELEAAIESDRLLAQEQVELLARELAQARGVVMSVEHADEVVRLTSLLHASQEAVDSARAELDGARAETNTAEDEADFLRVAVEQAQSELARTRDELSGILLRVHEQGRVAEELAACIAGLRAEADRAASVLLQLQGLAVDGGRESVQDPDGGS